MKHVLIVEDEADIAENLAYNMRRAGFAVAVAETGEKALRLALDKRNPPALIVLDVMLPGMSGIELCRRLKREFFVETVPIVIISAKASKSDVEAGLAAGADEYITKPFSTKHVVSCVSSLLNAKKEPAAAARTRSFG